MKQMKNLLVLTVALFVMASCSDDEVEKITFDSSVFGIEKIIVNNTTYSLKDSSFLIDKGADSPLYLTGSGYGPNYQELDYAFVSQTESLSSVAAICTKGEVNVSVSQTSTTKTYVLILYATSPKVKMIYKFSAPANRNMELVD